MAPATQCPVRPATTRRRGCRQSNWPTARTTRRRSSPPGRTASRPSRRRRSPRWRQPQNLVRVQSALGDGLVYGIGMPIVITLGHGVSKDDEAKIQKRLTVVSTPQQTGSWYWMSNKEIHYRPKTYWQPGTKLHIAVQTGGVPFGDGYYGKNDLTVDADITDEPVAGHRRRQDPRSDGRAERQGRQDDAGEPRQGEHAVVVRCDGHHDPQAEGTVRLVARHRRHPGQRARRLQGTRVLHDAADVGRPVHPRGAVVGGVPGSHRRLTRLHERVDGQREVDVRELAHRRPGDGEEHQAQGGLGRRLDRLERQLGHLRQGQRAARPPGQRARKGSRRDEAERSVRTADARTARSIPPLA